MSRVSPFMLCPRRPWWADEGLRFERADRGQSAQVAVHVRETHQGGEARFSLSGFVISDHRVPTVKNHAFNGIVLIVVCCILSSNVSICFFSCLPLSA